MAPIEAPEGHGQAGFECPIAIAYGSQTGTAEEVAWDLAREGRRRGFRCEDPQACNDLDLQGLCKLRVAVFVVSTTGQGDPPVNMRRFWSDLLVASLPKTVLGGLRFAVFGLGDRHYREFNYAARKLDARLAGLGAECFYRLGLGDDQHDFGFEQELDPWSEGLWEELAALCPPREVEAAEAQGRLECRYEVEELGDREDPAPAHAGGGCSVPPGVHSSEEVFVAEVIGNRSLCTEEHAREEQDVRNIRFAAPEGRQFEAGDVCVVWPQADPILVRRFVVETLERDLHQRIRVLPRRQRAASAPGTASIFPTSPLSLEDIFTSYVDISALPTRHFFQVLSMHTTDELHAQKLREFSSRTLEAKDALYEYCKREKRSAAEIMWDFWTAKPPLAELLGALPPMRPRRYSIASSPRWQADLPAPEAALRLWMQHRAAWDPLWRPQLLGAAGNAALRSALEGRSQAVCSLGSRGGQRCRFDLCVAVVHFTTRTGRKCRGLCSTFLQQAEAPSSVLCSFERGTLALPPLHVPLILICPGTGLSPCRALVQQRHLELAEAGALKAGSRFVAGLKDLMFLGFRHQDGDYLYGDEWGIFSPWLAVHAAFSRDHPDRKVYVQDVIEEHGEHVCRLLDAGARIYVCGRSHPMPSQVFDSLTEVLQTHRGLAAELAAARLREMQRVQRYICDTWG